jgi:hypothetical protein
VSCILVSNQGQDAFRVFQSRSYSALLVGPFSAAQVEIDQCASASKQPSTDGSCPIRIDRAQHPRALRDGEMWPLSRDLMWLVVCEWRDDRHGIVGRVGRNAMQKCTSIAVEVDETELVHDEDHATAKQNAA